VSTNNIETTNQTYVLTKEAARMLGVTLAGLRWLANQGVLPCIRARGGRSARIFLLKDVLDLKQRRDNQQLGKDKN
jgi:hypothetical protein